MYRRLLEDFAEDKTVPCFFSKFLMSFQSSETPGQCSAPSSLVNYIPTMSEHCGYLFNPKASCLTRWNLGIQLLEMEGRPAFVNNEGINLRSWEVGC